MGPGAGTEIGAGSTNTMIIDTSSCITPTDAAPKTADLVNGYDDWFLPSINELIHLDHTIGRQAPAPNTNVAGLKTGNVAYWSSTETNANTAFWLNQSGRGTNNGTKSSNFNVRPVRAF